VGLRRPELIRACLLNQRADNLGQWLLHKAITNLPAHLDTQEDMLGITIWPDHGYSCGKGPGWVSFPLSPKAHILLDPSTTLC